MIKYSPLHVHDSYSQLDGAALTNELAERCKELGHTACATTNHGNVLGHFAFNREMRKVGIKPIFGCCLPGQLIYVRSGVKPIEDISPGEEVLTHRGRYRKVIRVMRRSYSGDIVGVTARNCETVWLTPEHPVLVKKQEDEVPQWIRADKVPHGTANRWGGTINWRAYACVPKLLSREMCLIHVLDYLDQTIYTERCGIIWRPKIYGKGDREVNFKMPASIPVTEDFARFIGIYLADGNLSRDSKGEPCGVRVTLNRNTKTHHIKAFSSFARQMGFLPNFYERPERGSVEIEVCNKALAKFVLAFCGEHFDGKRIPELFFEASEAIKDAFLQGLEADAKINHETGYVQLKMANRNIVYGARILAASLGWLGKAAPYNHKGSLAWITIYQRKAAYRRYLKTNEFLMPPIRSVARKSYKGLVFNLEVEEDNSYVTDFAVHNCEMYLVPNMHEKGKQSSDRRDGEVKAFDYAHITILARNQKGYENLLKLTTLSYREGFYYKPRMDAETLFRHSKGLTVLSGCVIGHASKLINIGQEEEAFFWLQKMSNNLESFYCELIPCPGLPISENALPWLYAMAKELKLPMIATDDSHFVRPEDFVVQDTLLCVNTNQKVKGERKIQLPDIHYRCSGDEVLNRLQKCLFGVPEGELREIVERSIEIADACEVELPKGSSPVYAVPKGLTAELILKREGIHGLFDRLHVQSWDEVPIDYEARLRQELDILCRCEMANYLLVVWDLVREMRSRNILVVPRGSAGGSLVLWALGVTVVDPIQHNLSFERFCDTSKRDLDIDLDFQHDRRAEAFKYLESKYGSDNCAHVANVVTFGARQALIDAGKALEIPEDIIATMAYMVPEGESSDAGLHDTGVLRRLFDNNETAKKLLAKCPELEIAARLEGQVRNTSVHAGGFLVSARPIAEVTALMGKEGEDRIASLTKDEAAALGLLKIDVLGSKTLTAVAECLQEIGKDAEWLYNLPLEDEKAFELLAEGRNLGLFQLQGTAAGRIMRELKPKTFKSFTAVSALARPGPLQSGGAKQYVARARGIQPMPQMHPLIAEALSRTFGVMLFQEQGMQLVGNAGFEIEDVQKFRKLISKIEGADAVDPYLEPFAVGFLERGVEIDEVEEVWGQLLKAGNYLFPESHAVQYAYVGIWTAYLKAHYPAIYTAALCRNMSAKAEEKVEERQFRLLREFCEREGKVELLHPCADPSFKAADEWLIFGGWSTLKGVGPKITEKLEKLGPWESWGVFLDDKNVPKTVKKAITVLGLPQEELDSDAIEHFSRWYPYRPLTTEEEELRRELRCPQLGALSAEKFSDRHEAMALGRVTRINVVDLAQQARKYGNEAPKADLREKITLTITDEEGSLDVGLSAKIWRDHRDAGLFTGKAEGLGNTLALRVWFHAEMGRWFVKKAAKIREWKSPVAKAEVDQEISE